LSELFADDNGFIFRYRVPNVRRLSLHGPVIAIAAVINESDDIDGPVFDTPLRPDFWQDGCDILLIIQP